MTPPEPFDFAGARWRLPTDAEYAEQEAEQEADLAWYEEAPERPRRGGRPAAPDAPLDDLHHRLAVTRREAGRLLGRSPDWVEDHVIPDVRTIRKAATVLIPVRELEDWVERQSARALRR